LNEGDAPGGPMIRRALQEIVIAQNAFRIQAGENVLKQPIAIGFGGGIVRA
jgi:hypothetical protein